MIKSSNYFFHDYHDAFMNISSSHKSIHLNIIHECLNKRNFTTLSIIVLQNSMSFFIFILLALRNSVLMTKSWYSCSILVTFFYIYQNKYIDVLLQLIYCHLGYCVCVHFLLMLDAYVIWPLINRIKIFIYDAPCYLIDFRLEIIIFSLFQLFQILKIKL